MLQDPHTADDVASADTHAAAEHACDVAAAPEPKLYGVQSATAYTNSISNGEISPCTTAELHPSAAPDATTAIPLSAARCAPAKAGTAANNMTPRQRWRSAQPDWSVASHHHECSQPSSPAVYIPASLQDAGPQSEEPSVFYFERTGPLVTAVARLQEACELERVQLQLPFAVRGDIQRLRHRAAYAKAAAAKLQQAPPTAEADAAIAAERERFVWSLPELKQILWLLASAYQNGPNLVQQQADELRLVLQKQCRIWEWSAQCERSLVLINAVADNLLAANTHVLSELSNNKQLHGRLWDCRPSAKGLIPILQFHVYLIQQQHGIRDRILQLQPRTWNTLGATRLDWRMEPKHLDVVELTNAVLKVIWKAEYVPAFQPALDLVRAVAAAVSQQLKPETTTWDRMAVEYCNRINGLKLEPLYTRDFPVQKNMMRVVDEAKAAAEAGVCLETVSQGSLWLRVRLFLGWGETAFAPQA